MQLSNIAARIYTAFANTGTKNTIPVASQIGITAGAASYTDGFPPLTLTPVASGGVPPYGADFNGILNAITTIQKWQSGGGLFQYDATWSSTNGGYPQGAWLLKATGTGFWVNLVDNNTTNPDSSGANWVDAGIQLSSGQIAVAAGTADALTATFGSSPITLTNGLSFIVRANLANATTTPTFAPNGLTAHAIVKGNGLPLAAGDIAGAGHWLELQYDTTLTAWVLQNPANGIVTSKPGNFSGSYGYNASQALPANQIGMQLYFYGSTAGQTLTLPLRSATTIGNAFWFVNLASVPVTVASSGSDTLGISTPMQSFSYPASVVLQPGDSTCLVNDGFNWLEQQGVRAVNSPLIRAIGPAGYSATATIALSDLNRPIGGFPTAPITLTIPAGTTAGQSVTLTNFSQTAGAFITVSTTGAQRLYFQGLSGQTSIVLGLGDSVTLVFDGGNWIQVSGAAQFGIGQTWQSVVGSRVYGTTYTNTTGKTIAVSGYGTNVSSGALSVTVAGVQIFAVEAASGAPIVGYSFIVPPGGTYSITVTAGTVTNSVWAELR